MSLFNDTVAGGRRKPVANQPYIFYFSDKLCYPILNYTDLSLL